MKPSIRLNLLKWLIAPLLLINLIGAGLTYWFAWTPAQIAFDQSLADTAWALIPRLHETQGNLAIDLSQQAEQVIRFDHFDTIYFVVRKSNQQVIVGDHDFPLLRLSEKLNDPVAYEGSIKGEPVRIITLKTLVGTETVYIGVAETLRKRNHIRSQIFFVLMLLEAILTVVSIAIAGLAVTRGLSPLKKMQADLNSRRHDDLPPLADSHVALELRPVADAINSLLNKVQTSASAQQAFLANVAHQLRTPLAGLKMQIEWLAQRYASEPETTHSISLMMSSTDRMIRQSNQLLALARVEPSHVEKTRLEAVELDKLVEESVQYFVEEAHKKNIDLGFDLQPTTVMGDRFLLRDMIDNLIDNAIRYSPPEGTVTVSCFQEENQGIFSVEDSGPGIADSERELIFNRFYRINDKVAGSGLGLSIVRDIVKAHSATIVLTSGSQQVGTVFSVRFPG